MTNRKAQGRRENVGNRKKLKRQWLGFLYCVREESLLKIIFFEYYLAC